MASAAVAARSCTAVNQTFVPIVSFTGRGARRREEPSRAATRRVCTPPRLVCAAWALAQDVFGPERREHSHGPMCYGGRGVRGSDAQCCNHVGGDEFGTSVVARQ